MENSSTCCSTNSSRSNGFWRGLAAGLFPHSFCLLFIGLSIVGATGASALTKKFLLIPHFFTFLIAASFLFAAVSAIFYLKRIGRLSFQGAKNKKGYLALLFTTTIATNLILMNVVFPVVANIQPVMAQSSFGQTATVSLTVDIPCSGHAPIIIDEIKTDPGVLSVQFAFPSTFSVVYDPTLTSLEQIKSLKAFQTFQLINN